jgi:hypothetical protein
VYYMVHAIWVHSSHLTVLESIRSSLGSSVLVAQACNPSYSGGRDQEDGSLRPARASSL